MIRETAEEVGLLLRREQLIYRRDYWRPFGRVAFFAAHLPAAAASAIVLGAEGQGWWLMAPEEFPAHPETVPHFWNQVHSYLAQQSLAR